MQRIVRVACSVCRRTWAVYEGTLPRMWTALEQQLVCDLPACREAAGAPTVDGRRAALNRK